jgi:hypothetical protein
MRPFPDPKADPLEPNTDLQQAFDNAVARAPQPVTAAPIVIVAISENGAPHGVAGQLDTQVHYSASLLKVAAMYAAFELRKAANEMLADVQPAAADVFATLRSEFDPVIRSDRVPQLAGLADNFLLPSYEKVFAFDRAIAKVNFSQDFFSALFSAIADGNNVSAGTCIQRLGFGYLTKALAEADFFHPERASDPAAGDNIWLCGDFGNGFPPQRIPCLNDTPVAQATSARQMARLFTLLFDKQLIADGVSDDAMLNLLLQAILPPRVHLLLNRDTTVGYVTLNSKIGLGPLNSGPQVASEAAVLRENSTGRSFIAVFQNQRFVNDASIQPISRIVDDTLASFLFP